MKRQVHLRHRGMPNRKSRKLINLWVSQWKRRRGIPAHETIPPMDYMRAAYGEIYYRLRPSPLMRLLVRHAFG